MKRALALALAILLLGVAVVLFTPWFIGVERATARYGDLDAEPPYRFPDTFMWGVATAAQQIEHQQPSDWTAFENAAVADGRTGTGETPGQARPGHIHHLDQMPPDVRRKKTDFDTRFAADFARLADLGVNAYRFSISWSRLFPRPDMTEPDPAGVDFYRQLLGALKTHGLTPHVTLFHFSTPEWFWQETGGRRGWERADAMDHWRRYVDAVVAHFGADVRDWSTLNEPMVYVYNGYLEGIFPPLERRAAPIDVAPVIHRLLEAHALAYQAIHRAAAERGGSARVGLTQHTRAFEPWSNTDPLDRIAAGFVRQIFIWDILDAIESGTYTMTDTDYRADVPALAGTQDYIGINYYGRFYVDAHLTDLDHPTIRPHDPRDPDETQSDLGWAIHPKGFGDILIEAHQRYKKPIQILENGLADAAADDHLRQTFLVTHLREIWRAMNEHDIPIDGYFHWSHLDNFEWAEGFGPRFGLFAVDYQNDFARTPRPSAALYGRIIRHGVTAAMWQKYGPDGDAAMSGEDGPDE